MQSSSRPSVPSRHAAVCGKPISHSLSPVIHAAGYAAAGLLTWSYTAIECAEAELPALVAGLGPQWAGLSLTMPLKEVALTLAAAASPVAIAIGAANTLVRRPDGTWFADNTDVPGMVRVLGDAGLARGPSVTVLGGGGTARAALAAAAQLGAVDVTVVTRRPEAREELAPAAAALGVTITGVEWADAPAAFDADAVISTVPKGAADALATAVKWRPGTVLFDAIYDPWPTPLAAAAAQHGVPVVSGLDLLLAQALGQFEQFTGVRPAPEAAMRAALTAASAVR
ncbi:shikimate dehydrogenase [Actinoplanes auranticolor]|uniref:Shikimate 5-dehydrogenase n=1 Tax=Actinoplanes auranticolor TaxID=47988 RepID=A0A919SPD1_9ACTN|nr:shikimate dehydrogenase [Actinoplanes auranticolor]GIM75860.1 shikimate 5-dehydrogenase [Actinoplanes auranticolor]